MTSYCLQLIGYKLKKDFQRICRFFPKVYNVFSLGIPLDEEVVPYLFVLDRGMRVIDTFIPDKDLPKLTNRYFERITTTLSRNKAYNYKYYKKKYNETNLYAYLYCI